MKEEKVMYVDLPKDAEYRKAYVAEDGKVAITYAEETVNDNAEVLPKPTPLIGGTEVYQKEGLPYWYCRIKDGRDEFMHLYFGDLTIDDILTENGEKRMFITANQKAFREDVMEDLKNMPKKGFRWIPVYEPSRDDDGNLQFISGANVLGGLNNHGWEKAFQNYSRKNGSRMASTTTYRLLLLRLLKDGFASIEQLVDYYTPSDKILAFREREHLGGLYGLTGDNAKIVKSTFNGSYYYRVGGHLHSLLESRGADNTNHTGVGLLELTK